MCETDFVFANCCIWFLCGCPFIVVSVVFLQVNIQVPAPDQQSDKIAITGLANHLDRAKEGLLERVRELQAEQEDRVREKLGLYFLLFSA